MPEFTPTLFTWAWLPFKVKCFKEKRKENHARWGGPLGPLWFKHPVQRASRSPSHTAPSTSWDSAHLRLPLQPLWLLVTGGGGWKGKVGRAEERRLGVGREAGKMEMETDRNGGTSEEAPAKSPVLSGEAELQMRVTFVVLQLPRNLMLGNEEQHPLLDSGVESQSFQPGETAPLLQFLSPSPPLYQPGRAVRYRCSGCAQQKADVEGLLWRRGCWMNVGNPALAAAPEEPLAHTVRGAHCLEAAPVLTLPSHAPRSLP